MHTFLRLFAYMLPAHNLREMMVILEYFSHLTSKKFKADYLDWTILKTDLLLNLPSLEFEADDESSRMKVHDHLLAVTTALASMERFEEAAAICVEIGDTFPESPVAYKQAGSAFQFLGKDDLALECFAKHLGQAVRNDPNPDLNNPDYESLLTGVLMSYLSKFEKSLQGRDGTVPSRVIKFTDEEVEAIGCVTLLSTAHRKFEPLSEGFGMLPGTNLSSLLKNEFRKAKKVLVRLMRSGSVTEYKRVFASCIRPNKPLPISSTFDTSTSNAWRQSQAKDARKGAQGIIKKGYAEECSVCGSKKSKLMCCPCKKVSYCNAECQLAHWKFHKRNCSHHQNKNAK